MPTPDHRPNSAHRTNLPSPPPLTPHHFCETAPLLPSVARPTSPPPPVVSPIGSNGKPTQPGPPSRRQPDSAPVHISYTSVGPSKSSLPHRLLSLPQPTDTESHNGQRFTLRLATATDSHAIEQIQRTYSNQLGFLTATAITSAINGNRVFVALLGRSVIGYSIHRLNALRQPGTATIYQLAIARPYRRRHYGQRLHDRTLQHITAMGSVVAQAWTRHDVDGHHFFRRMHYIPFLCKLPNNARRQPLTLWRRLLHPAGQHQLHDIPAYSGSRHKRH